MTEALIPSDLVICHLLLTPEEMWAMFLMVTSHCLLQTYHSSTWDFLWPNLACAAVTFSDPVLLYPKHGQSSISFIHQSTVL